MAKQSINIGSVPNDGTGSTLRDAGDLINDNFNEIYSAIGDGTTLTSGTFLTTANTETVSNKTFNTTNTFPTLSITADDSSAQSISLGGSILFTGGSGITTSISGNEITFATDGSIVTETSSDVLTNKTINGPDNTLTNIANGSLANSSITLGSDTLNLGDTSTTITGLSLDGTGTIDLTGSGSKARFNFAGFGSLPTAATYEGMFAYDTTGQVPYVADAGGWTRIQTENDSISVHSDVNLTGIADNYILKWSSAQARFNVVAQSGVSFTTSKLTGDGSTTDFTINSGRAVDDVLVFVDGICFVPTDDYTISGTTLTFTSAPVSSAEIVVRYLG